MSYGVRYRLTFIDDDGNNKRLDLLQRDYSGSVSLSEGVGYSPVFVNFEGQNSDKWRTLWGTELEARLFSIDDFEYLNLLKTASEREFRLELYENETIKHAGYVIPDSVSEAYVQKPYRVRVGAVALGALQGIPYKDDNGDFLEGRVSQMDVITRCLNKLDFGLDIWDSLNTYEDQMDSGSTDSPLTQAEVDQEDFIFEEKGRRKALSCYEVLERVLKPYVCNLFQDEGVWKIIPIELRGQSRTVRVYDNDGNFQSSFTHNPEDTSYEWIGANANLRTLPAISEISSTYEHGLIPDLVGNHQFNDGFYGVDTGGGNFINVPNEWEVNDVSDFVGAIFNPAVNKVAASIEDLGPSALFLNSDKIQDGGYIEFEGNQIIQPEENDSVLFSIYHAPQSRGRIIGTSEPRPDETVSQFFEIRIGNHYLTASGSWTTNPTQIEIVDLGDGNPAYTTLATLPVTLVASGFRRFEIASQPIPEDGVPRVRIYKPISENQGGALGESFAVVAISEFSLEYYPDGEPQTVSRTFVGERDVDSFSQEIDYDLDIGDGPTNIHLGAITIDGLKTENWARGALSGSISQVAIRTIAGESQEPYNIISGVQRTFATLDRHFTDQGTKYIIESGSYDERKLYFDGQYVEQFESTVPIPIAQFQEQQTAARSTSGTGGQTVNLDGRYFKITQNLAEGEPELIRDNLDLGSFSLLDELPKLTADGGVAFTTGSEEIWDVSSEVWDQSMEVWFNEDAFYNGTQETTLTALFDDQTIGLTNGDLEVKDDGISTAKIQNDAIVEAKLADDSVSTGKIQNDAVIESKVADDAISTAKIQDSAVTNVKLQNSTISGKQLGENLDSLSAGNGLVGNPYDGSSNETHALGTPSTITVGGSNNVTSDSHEHALDLSGRILTAGDGLTGLGDLGDDRTVNLGEPSTITVGGTNSTTSNSHEHALDLSGRTLTGGTGVDEIGDLGADRTISTVPATPSQEGHVSTVAQSFGGNKTFEDEVKLKDLIEADDFDLTTDFTGVGWQATDAGDFNIRNLVVREAARFRELIIDQLSAVGGSFLYSAARGKVESRDGNVITLEDPNDTGATQFAVNDIFVVRVVDIDGAEVKFITGRVSAVDGVEITLAQDIADTSGSITSISAGDVIVQRGNTTDTTRQNAIYVTATDSDAPSQKYFTGLDSIDAFNQEQNIVVQSGNLENITDAEGFGFFGENTFLTGSLLVGDLTQSQSGKFLKFDGTDLTGRFSNIEFESDEFKLESNDLLLQSGTDAKLQVGDMTFGLNVDGGVNGIKIDSDNFWYDNSQFNVGGEDGIRFFPSQVWDDSAEVWDQSAAFWDAPIRIGSDTVFGGNLEAVGGTFTGTLQAVDGIFAGTLQAADGSFTGTLDAVDGSFKGTLDAVTGSFGDVEISADGKLDGSSWSLDRTKFNLGQARITNANESFFIRGTSNGMSIITEDEGVQNVILDVLEDRIQVRGIRGESLSAQSPTDIRFRLPDGDPLIDQKWYTKEFGDLTSSDVVVCVSQATVVPPSQPSNVATCDNTAAFGFGSIKIQWDAVQNADTYRIQRSTSETTGFTDLTVITGTEHTDVIFEGGFWYRVRAENAAGNSTYTSAVFGEVGVTPPC